MFLNRRAELTNTTLATRMAENRLTTPRQFNTEASDIYTEWKIWIESFKIYAIAVELEEKSENVQLATMLHCLGPAIHTCKAAIEALEDYFAPKRNVVAE